MYYLFCIKSLNFIICSFYNNHSSFVHGGLDQHNRDTAIVVGQKNIHNKIQQLSFRDCHAKISQVDAQATLGNGVVVQVTGELSNDGQPMRRFTQTFVLAAQSPKKYYVHNDIFRYQDFYSDDEVDGDEGGRSENEEEITESEQLESTNINPQPQIYYPLGVQAPAAQNVPIQAFAQAPQMNGVVHEEIIQVIAGPTVAPQINMPIPPTANVQPQQSQQLQQQPQQPPLQQQQQQPQPPQSQPENLPMHVEPHAGNKISAIPQQMEDNIDINQNLNTIENVVNNAENIANVDQEVPVQEPINIQESMELIKDDGKLIKSKQFNIISNLKYFFSNQTSLK